MALMLTYRPYSVVHHPAAGGAVIVAILYLGKCHVAFCYSKVPLIQSMRTAYRSSARKLS